MFEPEGVLSDRKYTNSLSTTTNHGLAFENGGRLNIKKVEQYSTFGYKLNVIEVKTGYHMLFVFMHQRDYNLRD